MKTKTISLLLVLCMCLFLFAGCQDAKLYSLSEDAAASGEAVEPTTTPQETATPKDYTAAYLAYPSDQVMLTVDGYEVTWGELFYWYIYDVSNIESYFGAITDWDAVSPFDSTKSYREYVSETGLNMVSQYCSLEKKAADMGIALTDIDETMLESAWQDMIDSYGGGSEDALLEFLQSAYLSKDVYQHINRVTQLYTRVLAEMFGENGEKISDAEIKSVGGDMGYMRVKHLLISTLDDTKTELPEAQLAEKEARANELYEELSAITDKTALEARLDELIAAEGDDPGAAYYTGGYTFIYGDYNNEPFESASQALGEYELSGVVKSSLGYHIILRLPLDKSVPMNYTSETAYTTIGTVVAQELFNAEASSWAAQAEVVTTDAYDNLDLAAIFELANEAAKAAAETPSAEPEESPAA